MQAFDGCLILLWFGPLDVTAAAMILTALFCIATWCDHSERGMGWISGRFWKLLGQSLPFSLIF